MAYKKRKLKTPPPLIPHMEYNDYGVGVAVVRIPAKTPDAQRIKVINDARQLAKAHSSWY